MIKFANEDTKPLVRQMWKACFGDTDEFLDILFKYKYKNENTLIYFEGDTAVASLQMLPYTITFYGKTIPFAYMAGLCTLPPYRNKGYMPLLINKSHQILNERGISLAILIPAEDWLYKYYEKFGYTQVFDKGTEPIHSIKNILDKHPDMNAAYAAYNDIYNHKDFCVQKSFEDFFAIATEQKMDGFPEKYNLPGMAHIIDPNVLINLYKEQNNEWSVNVKLNNDFDHSCINQIILTNKSLSIEVDTQFLCRLLFGYRTDQLTEPYKTLFPVRQPIMNQMLE